MRQLGQLAAATQVNANEVICHSYISDVLFHSRRSLVSQLPSPPVTAPTSSRGFDASDAVPVNIAQSFECIRVAVGSMAAAHKTLADLLLKESCPALASFVSEVSKDDTKSEVVAAAAVCYKSCKQSLSDLQKVKQKYPQAPDRPIDTASLHAALAPASIADGNSAISSHTSGGPRDQAVAITCVRPVASAAASAAKDIESLFKSLDAIHFIQSNSIARISKILAKVFDASRTFCAPSTSCHSPPTAPASSHAASASSPHPANLPLSLVFKQPKSVARFEFGALVVHFLLMFSPVFVWFAARPYYCFAQICTAIPQRRETFEMQSLRCASLACCSCSFIHLPFWLLNPPPSPPSRPIGWPTARRTPRCS